MNGLTAFLSNMVGSFAPTAVSLFGHGFKGVKTAFQSMSDATTGAHLTGAQQEANQFAAQQAQENRAFEERMSNTAYQRGTTDMVSAGLNPALMYGNGSAASTPSGSAASSVSPGQPDVVGLLGQMQNLSLLESQRRNLDAQTEKLLQEREEVIARTDNLRRMSEKTLKEMDLMEFNMRKLNLEGDALEIANSYLAAEKDMALAVQDLNLQDIRQQIENNRKLWEKMDAETKVHIQSLRNAEQELKNLLAQETLTKAQAGQVSALTQNIKEERGILQNQKKLTDKQINWFTHDKIVDDVVSAGRIAGNFIGLGKLGKLFKGSKSTSVDLTGYGAYGSYD